MADHHALSQNGRGHFACPQEPTVKRALAVLFATLTLLTLGIGAAQAGSPHFVDDKVTYTVDENTLTVTGKEAGLGDEAQVHIVLTAEAVCVNGGGNHPQAANKESTTAEGDFPVQNGKANFELSVTATFDPSAPCPDPMAVQYTSIVVTDTTHGVTAVLL